MGSVSKLGKLLISDPFLNDPFFKRAVILITEHNKNGTIGFMLNKPSELQINDVLGDFPSFASKVFYGGPVQKNSLHYLHSLGETLDGSIKIFNKVFWGGSFDQLKVLIETKQVKSSQIRFFIGYSGWAPKQLDEELSQKSWILAPGRLNHVLAPQSEGEELWSSIIKNLGQKYAVFANFPENPSLN